MDNFVKTLIEEVKSQGVFDEFRFNCCLADVDTKPAYQNVRNRVETAVNDFLAKQKWTPETNKVQLRERLRKHLLDSDVLDKGVDHIVDQVVNPKVATIFEPKIESIAYKYLGITRPPPPTNPPPRPPLLPAPPLPPYSGHHMGHMNGGNLLKVETTDSLLPTDLEQISPDSDRESINIKSESRDDIKEEDRPPGVDGDDFFDDDDDDAVSPPFEPVGSIKEETNNASLNTSGSPKDIKELVNESPDAGVSQSSQLSQVSSDSRLTIASMDVPQQTSANDSNMAANMSEEAQMPKFNENSIDGNNSSRQLHFDIKKDAITFEGTDRRNSLSESTNGGTHALSIEDSIMCEVEANLNNDNISTEKTTPKLLPEQPSDPLVANSSRESESTFAVFAELAPGAKVPKEGVTAKAQEPLLCGLEATPEEPSPVETEKKSELAKTPDEVATLTLPIASDEPKDDLIKPGDMTTSPASASSSSQTKKHSHSHSKDKDKRHHSHSRSDDKQRRKSRDREREKSRSKTSSSKHSSHNSSHSSSSKHRSSSSSKNEKTSTSTTSNRSTQESSSSSSKRSSLRHESSSHKKHKSSTSSSRSDRDRDRSRDSRESHSHSHSHHSRSHNGSGSSKRSDRDRERDRNKSSSSSTSTSITTIIQDDHNEEKAKLLKRNSNDSNDEGKPPGLMNKPLTESTDSQSKEKTATAKNGKDPETNGKSNGTNDNHNKSNDQATAELMAATNVIIVSDMLQQSTVNYVDINSAGQTEKIRTRIKSPTTDVAKESAEQSIESVAEEPKSKSPATVVETEIKTASKLPADQTVITHEVVAEEPAEDLVMEPVMNSSEEAVEEQVKELVVEPSGKPVEEQVKKPVDKPAKVPAVEHVVEPEIESVKATTAEIDVDKNVPLVSVSGKDSVIESNTVEVKDEPEPAEPTAKFELIKESTSSEETSSYSDFEISKPFTHFEDETNMFKERLLQIEQHIKDRRQLLSVISELEDTNCMRRSTSKRRLSSEASSSPKPHSSSSGSSSSCAGSPAKRARRSDAAKTSPTPSEVSVNSKENEELEKHQKDARTTKRLTQKQCQQQRYSNDDLYKPRPLLSQRSRRRGLDSIL